MTNHLDLDQYNSRPEQRTYNHRDFEFEYLVFKSLHTFTKITKIPGLVLKCGGWYSGSIPTNTKREELKLELCNNFVSQLQDILSNVLL